MLTLGYHVAWGGLKERLGYETETATSWPAQAVVLVLVGHIGLHIRLGLTLCLSVSALLVMVGQRGSVTKTVRDYTVAALTMVSTDVTHSPRAHGLCNATELRK